MRTRAGSFPGTPCADPGRRAGCNAPGSRRPPGSQPQASGTGRRFSRGCASPFPDASDRTQDVPRPRCCGENNGQISFRCSRNVRLADRGPYRSFLPATLHRIALRAIISLRSTVITSFCRRRSCKYSCGAQGSARPSGSSSRKRKNAYTPGPWRRARRRIGCTTSYACGRRWRRPCSHRRNPARRGTAMRPPARPAPGGHEEELECLALLLER